MFIHGDLQIAHVFVDGDEVSGIIDWSQASQGDALYDLATLTLAHEEHLDEVIAGYGADLDVDLIGAWWSFRSLIAIRWLAENGYGPSERFPEVAVLRSGGGPREPLGQAAKDPEDDRPVVMLWRPKIEVSRTGSVEAAARVRSALLHVT